MLEQLIVVLRNNEVRNSASYGFVCAQCLVLVR